MTTTIAHDAVAGSAEKPTFDGPVRPASPDLARLLAYLDAEVVDRDEQHRHPFAEFEVIKAARLGALRLPVEQGGGGATLAELFETVIALGEVDPNITHSVRNHLNFTESLLRLPAGHPDLRYLDEVRAGRLFGHSTTELSNKSAGRRDRDWETSVVETPDGLRLTGTKFYSTGNLYADFLIVHAAGPDGEAVRIVVPSDREGVARPHDWDGIGQRFTGSGTTSYDNVLVHRSEFLESGEIYGDLTYSATFPQLFLTATIAGILRRITRDAADLIRNKQRTFYHAATTKRTEDPTFAQTVGQLASQAFVAEAAVLNAAAALGETFAATGTEQEPQLALRSALKAAKAKVVVDEIALRAAGDLFDVGGGQAVRRSAHLDRHWRNIRTLAAHNPKTLKARAVGANVISGEPLPNGAFF